MAEGEHPGGVDPERVLVLRHRPQEHDMNKALPWLAAEQHDVFNAYQQTQGEKLEKVMSSMIGGGYVASFIGHEPGKALFIGLYSIGKAVPLTEKEYREKPEYLHMKDLGIQGFSETFTRKTILWFDLALTEIYFGWKGKLVVGWPPPERSWWRRSHRNDMPVLSIFEESALEKALPKWEEINLTRGGLTNIPSRLRSAMQQWRGIYFIFDVTDSKGYVGSASGEENIYGRWQDYAASGHGGNRWLKKRDPRNFRFSILQRVSPDMSKQEIDQIEASWKERLHTRHPLGLNDN